MTGPDRLSLACLVATLGAGMPLFAVTQDRSYLLFGLLLMGLSVGLGAIVRRLGAREVTVRLVQLAPAALLPVLVPALRYPPWKLAAETIDFVQQSFAPMPYQEGFAVFTTLLLWLAFLAVETLAIGLRTPAWTFPVLILPYAVSALAIYTEANPVLFVFPAIGWAMLLATGVRNQALDALPRKPLRGWRTGVTRAAAATTVITLVATALVSIPISERSAGAGNPNGSGAVLLGDPSLDLIRNVTSSSDQQVITYTTSDEAGEYLRLAALSVFDDRGFHLTSTDLVPLPLTGELPEIAGSQTVRTKVKIAELSSEYLPMPWLPTSAEVSDNWRYDPRTLAVVAIGDNRRAASRRLEYAVTSQRLPEVEDLLPGIATAGRPADGGLTLQLPDEISPEIRALAEQVTAGSATAGEKALALRDYLRSDAFTYSTVVSPGSTLQTMNDFLLGSRTGYCEQFAGGLAVLARMVDIPSRVVVGFLPGKRVGEHWEVSARNMHAWTELYFGDGVGWVPVDGTPGAAVGRPAASSPASVRPSSISPPPRTSSAAASPIAQPQTPTAVVGGNLLGAWPVVAGALAALLLVAVGPLLVRQVLRWRRLGVHSDPAAALEDAWSEVRAVVIDQGEEWPAGSTRRVAAELGTQLEAGAAGELATLALLVERSRYSGSPVPANRLAERVGVITVGMEKRWAEPTARLRRWWPRSLRPQRPSS